MNTSPASRHNAIKHPAWVSAVLASPAVAAKPSLVAAVDAILAASPFLARLLREAPELIDVVASGQAAARLEGVLAAVRQLANEDALELREAMVQLRQARATVALLVALADISGDWSLEQVTDALTRFADAAVDTAAALALRPLIARGHLTLRAPAPHEDAGTPPHRRSGLAIIAMGKHGAGELNYSSDIDLVLLFDEQAIAYSGPDDALTAFIKVAQTMVRLLQERTGDGYVFRVDLRLRPDPSATPLVLSMGAAEVYYQSMALAWERAAYIKARAAAGDLVAGDGFLKRMRPFVWRRSLDYTALKDISAIKAEIHAFHGHDDPGEPGFNIKLGRGGIREIEFLAQIQQLINGGREPTLRSRRTDETLAMLAKLGILPQRQADRLADAYRFLRTLEHRLQMMHDEQTQTLPSGAGDLRALARLAGFAGASPMLAALRRQSAVVRKAYAALLPAPHDGTAHRDQLPQEPESLARALKAKGFADPPAIVDMLERWRRGRYRALRTERARDLIEALLPAMIAAALKAEEPAAPLMRFDELLSRLPAGVQLLSVFEANPALLDLVFRILLASPQLGEDLAREPGQLDVLLDPDLFAPLPEPGALASELEARLAQAETLEACLDDVRRWRAERTLQLGVQLLEPKSRVRQTGGHFTALADAAVMAIKPRVEAEFAKAHGMIAGGDLAVLALGRYGGHQLSVGSDLDLVFLFTGSGESDGRRPLTATAYFNRLAQRLVTAMTVPTAAGALYDVDTRLRPSGEQGLLAVTLESFAAYQLSEAWTWEHMALTRARVVAGDPTFAAAIDALVGKVLCQPRAEETLRADVLAMRQDLRSHFPGRAPFDVKFCPGGMIDAEFIVQYLQLRHAAEAPQVIGPTLDASIDALSAIGVLTARQAEGWSRAYRTLSQLQMLLRLTRPDALAPADLPEGVQQAIARAMGVAGFAGVTRMIGQAQETIQALWATVFGKQTGHPAGRPKRKIGKSTA